ncbi:hypothetical protein Tco_0830009, partial [Tanacetum coccineum]
MSEAENHLLHHLSTALLIPIIKKVSYEDANLKFLRSLPSVWHVVATMIRGQPGLDELDFDDLYNNPECASTSKLKETLNSLSTSIEIQNVLLCSTSHYARKLMKDKTLQIDDDAMEEISSEESNNSSGDETLTGPLYENFKKEKAYKAVPPPTGTIIPPRADVAFTGINELAIRNKVDSDDEEVPLGFSEIKKQTVLKSETSSENKSPRSKDSLVKDQREGDLGIEM